MHVSPDSRDPVRYIQRVAEQTTDRSELWGYSLWVIGILLFAVSAAQNGDLLSFIASILFLVGIIVVMVPMIRRHRQEGS